MVDGEEYEGTPGLWELIVSKIRMITYIRMMIMTIMRG